MKVGKKGGGIGAVTVINSLAGAKVLGWGALFHSDHTRYLDPNQIDGYTYNPDDGKWYESPPAPDLGQWGWLEPADPEKNSDLDILRDIRIQHNDLERLGPNGDLGDVDPKVNDNFSSADDFIQRYDPLALDIDGDGIETLSANVGVTFDFDGDGLKTGTGWVKGDDGFLVLDRNGKKGTDLFLVYFESRK